MIHCTWKSHRFIFKPLPEPPDRMLKQLLFLTIILYVYLYPILLELISHWTRLSGAYLFLKDTYISVKHGCRRRCCLRYQLPTLHVKIFATNERPEKSTFTCDTHRLSFVMYNPDTTIICNTRKVFTGHLASNKIILETSEGVSTSTK